eukprot:g191.t1
MHSLSSDIGEAEGVEDSKASSNPSPSKGDDSHERPSAGDLSASKVTTAIESKTKEAIATATKDGVNPKDLEKEINAVQGQIDKAKDVAAEAAKKESSTSSEDDKGMNSDMKKSEAVSNNEVEKKLETEKKEASIAEAKGDDSSPELSKNDLKNERGDWVKRLWTNRKWVKRKLDSKGQCIDEVTNKTIKVESNSECVPTCECTTQGEKHDCGVEFTDDETKCTSSCDDESIVSEAECVDGCTIPDRKTEKSCIEVPQLASDAGEWRERKWDATRVWVENKWMDGVVKRVWTPSKELNSDETNANGLKLQNESSFNKKARSKKTENENGVCSDPSIITKDACVGEWCPDENLQKQGCSGCTDRTINTKEECVARGMCSDPFFNSPELCKPGCSDHSDVPKEQCNGGYCTVTEPASRNESKEQCESSDPLKSENEKETQDKPPEAKVDPSQPGQWTNRQWTPNEFTKRTFTPRKWIAGNWIPNIYTTREWTPGIWTKRIWNQSLGKCFDEANNPIADKNQNSCESSCSLDATSETKDTKGEDIQPGGVSSDAQKKWSEGECIDEHSGGVCSDRTIKTKEKCISECSDSKFKDQQSCESSGKCENDETALTKDDCKSQCSDSQIEMKEDCIGGTCTECKESMEKLQECHENNELKKEECFSVCSDDESQKEESTRDDCLFTTVKDAVTENGSAIKQNKGTCSDPLIKTQKECVSSCNKKGMEFQTEAKCTAPVVQKIDKQENKPELSSVGKDTGGPLYGHFIATVTAEFDVIYQEREEEKGSYNDLRQFLKSQVKEMAGDVTFEGASSTKSSLENEENVQEKEKVSVENMNDKNPEEEKGKWTERVYEKRKWTDLKWTSRKWVEREWKKSEWIVRKWDSGNAQCDDESIATEKECVSYCKDIRCSKPGNDGKMRFLESNTVEEEHSKFDDSNKINKVGDSGKDSKVDNSGKKSNLDDDTTKINTGEKATNVSSIPGDDFCKNEALCNTSGICLIDNKRSNIDEESNCTAKSICVGAPEDKKASEMTSKVTCERDGAAGSCVEQMTGTENKIDEGKTTEEACTSFCSDDTKLTKDDCTGYWCKESSTNDPNSDSESDDTKIDVADESVLSPLSSGNRFRSVPSSSEEGNNEQDIEKAEREQCVSSCSIVGRQNKVECESGALNSKIEEKAMKDQTEELSEQVKDPVAEMALKKVASEASEAAAINDTTSDDKPDEKENVDGEMSDKKDNIDDEKTDGSKKIEGTKNVDGEKADEKENIDSKKVDEKGNNFLMRFKRIRSDNVEQQSLQPNKMHEESKDDEKQSASDGNKEVDTAKSPVNNDRKLTANDDTKLPSNDDTKLPVEENSVGTENDDISQSASNHLLAIFKVKLPKKGNQMSSKYVETIIQSELNQSDFPQAYKLLTLKSDPPIRADAVLQYIVRGSIRLSISDTNLFNFSAASESKCPIITEGALKQALQRRLFDVGNESVTKSLGDEKDSLSPQTEDDTFNYSSVPIEISDSKCTNSDSNDSNDTDALSSVTKDEKGEKMKIAADSKIKSLENQIDETLKDSKNPEVDGYGTWTARLWKERVWMDRIWDDQTKKCSDGDVSKLKQDCTPTCLYDETIMDKENCTGGICIENGLKKETIDDSTKCVSECSVKLNKDGEKIETEAECIGQKGMERNKQIKIIEKSEDNGNIDKKIMDQEDKSDDGNPDQIGGKLLKEGEEDKSDDGKPDQVGGKLLKEGEEDKADDGKPDQIGEKLLKEGEKTKRLENVDGEKEGNGQKKVDDKLNQTGEKLHEGKNVEGQKNINGKKETIDDKKESGQKRVDNGKENTQTGRRLLMESSQDTKDPMNGDSNDNDDTPGDKSGVGVNESQPVDAKSVPSDDEPQSKDDASSEDNSNGEEKTTPEQVEKSDASQAGENTDVEKKKESEDDEGKSDAKNMKETSEGEESKAENGEGSNDEEGKHENGEGSNDAEGKPENDQESKPENKVENAEPKNEEGVKNTQVQKPGEIIANFEVKIDSDVASRLTKNNVQLVERINTLAKDSMLFISEFKAALTQVDGSLSFDDVDVTVKSADCRRVSSDGRSLEDEAPPPTLEGEIKKDDNEMEEKANKKSDNDTGSSVEGKEESDKDVSMEGKEDSAKDVAVEGEKEELTNEDKNLVPGDDMKTTFSLTKELCDSSNQLIRESFEQAVGDITNAKINVTQLECKGPSDDTKIDEIVAIYAFRLSAAQRSLGPNTYLNIMNKKKVDLEKKIKDTLKEKGLSVDTEKIEVFDTIDLSDSHVVFDVSRDKEKKDLYVVSAKVEIRGKKDGNACKNLSQWAKTQIPHAVGTPTCKVKSKTEEFRFKSDEKLSKGESEGSGSALASGLNSSSDSDETTVSNAEVIYEIDFAVEVEVGKGKPPPQKFDVLKGIDAEISEKKSELPSGFDIDSEKALQIGKIEKESVSQIALKANNNVGSDGLTEESKCVGTVDKNACSDYPQKDSKRKCQKVKGCNWQSVLEGDNKLNDNGECAGEAVNCDAEDFQRNQMLCNAAPGCTFIPGGSAESLLNAISNDVPIIDEEKEASQFVELDSILVFQFLSPPHNNGDYIWPQSLNSAFEAAVANELGVSDDKVHVAQIFQGNSFQNEIVKNETKENQEENEKKEYNQSAPPPPQSDKVKKAHVFAASVSLSLQGKFTKGQNYDNVKKAVQEIFPDAKNIVVGHGNPESKSESRFLSVPGLKVTFTLQMSVPSDAEGDAISPTAKSVEEMCKKRIENAPKENALQGATAHVDSVSEITEEDDKDDIDAFSVKEKEDDLNINKFGDEDTSEEEESQTDNEPKPNAENEPESKAEENKDEETKSENEPESKAEENKDEETKSENEPESKAEENKDEETKSENEPESKAEENKDEE